MTEVSVRRGGRAKNLRNGGISLWRRIGDALVAEIDGGVLAPGARLPADTDLAARFGVNRHTVRRALWHLQNEGLLRSERGRGTFVIDDVLEYRLGARTRWTQNLLAGHWVPARRLISVAEQPATAVVAEHLELAVGAPAALVVVLGEADGAPISLGRCFFPCERLPGVADLFRAEEASRGERLTITEVLRSAGILDYRRRLTRISSRTPSGEEARHLKMPANEPVLETESVDVDGDGRPITYAKTCFRSSRVQFVLET